MLVAACCAAAAAQQATIKRVATVRDLHDAMMTPASDAIFDVTREKPKDDEAWATLRRNAIILAESGNLLLLRRPPKDKGPWAKLSLAMVDAGAAAVKAVDARDVGALMKVTDRLVDVCEECHVYRDGKRVMAK
jgi:hypothetical protein